MDHRREPSRENRSTADKLLKYCLNQMRKRTVDEQLNDFAGIMGTAEIMKIVYKKCSIEVTYDIGSLHATVSGIVEYTCVRQCKLEVLNGIRVYCNYTNNRMKFQPGFVRKTETPDTISNFRDVYSEIALSEHNSTRGADSKVSCGLVLIDPDMNNSINLSKFVEIKKALLILKITYFQTGMEFRYDIGSYNSFTIGIKESKCISECKRQLLPKLGVFPYTVRTSTSCSTYQDLTIAQPRSTNTRSRSVTEELADRASAVMENLQMQEFSQSTDLFVDILVETNNASVQCLGYVTDCIVRKAIDEQEKIPMYAKLCSEANIKASEDPSQSRLEFPDTFKRELTRSCEKVLREAGVLSLGPSSRTAQRPGTFSARTSEESVGAADGSHLRALVTCRFICELFMQNGFKMITFVQSTMNTFMRARDAKSVECLCEMLSAIGSQLENLRANQYDVEQAYAQLARYAQLGSTDNGRTLLPRRTMAMVDRVLNERKCRQPGTPRNVFPPRSENRENRDRRPRRGPPRNGPTGRNRAAPPRSWTRR